MFIGIFILVAFRYFFDWEATRKDRRRCRDGGKRTLEDWF